MQDSIELEFTVLTSMLCYKEDARFFSEMLEINDFASPRNRKLFKAMVGITLEHGEVLVSMLHPILGDEDFWHLKDLVKAEPISVNPEAHARKLIELHHLREMDKMGTEMSKEARQPHVVYDELHEKYEQRLSKLGAIRWTDANPASVGVQDATEDIELTHQVVKKGGRPGLSTGLLDQDDIIRGFRKTDFIVTAARPGMGKTALMINEAKAIAEQGIPVLIFSLEMSEAQLYQRMIACDSKLLFSHLRDGKLRGDEWHIYNESAAKLHDLPIYVLDEPDSTMKKIRQVARKSQIDYGIQVIYIDYLQLIRAPQNIRRYEAVSAFSRQCKALAKELNIPVNALAQLNRDCETRNVNNKRPILADLRESGAIEQDADVVRFLYRHALYDEDMPNSIRHVVEIDVKKYRNGRTGICNVGFWGEYQMFGDVDHVTMNEYKPYAKNALRGRRKSDS